MGGKGKKVAMEEDGRKRENQKALKTTINVRLSINPNTNMQIHNDENKHSFP